MANKSTDGLVESGSIPPSYTNPSDDTNQPPSYNSVMDEIKAAKKTSKGRTDFLKNVWIILVNTSKLIVIYL